MRSRIGRPLLAFAAASLGLALALPIVRAADEPVIDLTPCDSVEGPPNNARFQPVGGVSLFTGGFTLDTLDYFGGGSPATTFYRSHFSLDTRSTSLGPAWQHNFDVRLRLAGNGQGDMLFTLPSGAVERFVRAWGNTPVTGKSRGYRILDRSIDGTWHITDDETVWHLSPTGDLVAVDTPDGTAEVGRADGRLVSVSDGVTPTLMLEYDSEGRLAGVVDASTGERFVGFAFDEAGRLNTVRRPHKTDEAYRYDGASARMATIARDGEVVLALTYDDEGRVIREQDALGLLDGAAVMYDYEPLPSGWVRTTVTYPESLVERGWHPTERAVHDDEARLREMVFQRTSGERLVGRYDYDSENRRIVIEDPCESLRPVPEMSPLWRLWFVLLSILVWLFG